MAKRKGADFDPDYDPEAANHAGEMMQGSITELRTRDKSDTRFEKRSHYDGSGKMGFDLSAKRRKK